MSAAIDVIVVFNDPDAALVVERERDGFANGGFGGKNADLEALRNGHLGEGFLGFEERSIAGAVFLAQDGGVIGRRDDQS